VIPVDALPELSSVDLSKTRLDIINSNHAKLLQGAIIAAEHPALEYVEIYSFGCGHDALNTDEVTRIMQAISKKSPLILKLDESDVSGPLRIRVRSFIETVMERRAREAFAKKLLDDPFPVKFRRRDKKLRVLLIPNVTRSFCKIATAALRNSGIRAEPLPFGGKDAIALGKKYVHNDICFPAQMVIGEALAALLSGKYKNSEVAVTTAKTNCDCRLVNYSVLTRKALDEAGFSDVPIASTDFFDRKKMQPGFKFSPITYAKMFFGLVAMEMLEYLRRKIRPYEINRGETNRVVEHAIDSIANEFAKKGLPGVYREYKKAINEICNIKYDTSTKKPLVFITGEYLLTFHEGSNYNIERYLEDNNIEVELPRMYDIYRNLIVHHTLSEIKDYHVFHTLFDTVFALVGDKYIDASITILERVAKKHPLYEKALRLPEAAKISDHIIDHSIQSGEGFLMIADILHKASQGVKAFAILQPWGCLPNHVCGRGILKKIKEEHPDIQVLALDYDPDTSFANIENRLQMLIMSARSFESEAA
jgi:predicted nucleotide-binding protein (sugar kinase/HSP70/actin superfamily)